MQKILSGQELSEKTKESMLWSTLLPLLFQIFRFAISVIVARLLDPRDFGIMGIASITIFYANSLTNFGFSTALIQRKEISEDHINSVFTINLIISIFLVVLTLLLAHPLAVFFKIPELSGVLSILSLIFLITAFYTMPITLLRRDVSFKLITMIELARGISNSVVSLGLAWAGFAYWSLVGGLVFSHGITTLMIMRKATWRPHFLFNKEATQEILNFASWNFVASQVRLLGDYADKFIVGKLLGAVRLGYYDKAFSIAYMPVESIAMKISGVMFSTFSRTQNDPRLLSLYLYKALAAISIICFPIFLGAISLGDQLVFVLFGEKWEPMTLALEILLAAFLLSSLTSVINSLNLSCGNYKKQIRARMACVTLLIGLCVVSARYSIEFVALSLFCYHFVFLILSLVIAKKNIPITFRNLMLYLRPSIFGACIMVIAVKTLEYSLDFDSPVMMLVLKTFAGAIVYILVICLSRFKEIQFLKDEMVIRFKNISQLINH